MGDMAEYYMELALAGDLDDFFADGEESEKDFKLRIWTTKDGRRINVKNMTLDHLVNAKEYLKKSSRKSELKAKWIDLFTKQIKKRSKEF